MQILLGRSTGSVNFDAFSGDAIRFSEDVVRFSEDAIRFSEDVIRFSDDVIRFSDDVLRFSDDVEVFFILHPAIKWLLLIIVESGKVGKWQEFLPTFSLFHPVLKNPICGGVRYRYDEVALAISLLCITSKKLPFFLRLKSCEKPP